jgi:hypothetical protein
LRHKANTLWVWQSNADNLPPVGVVPRAEEARHTTSLLRILPHSGLLLIEAPEPTPLFLAHYARNKKKGQALPTLGVIIDRLQWVFTLSSSRKRAIALLDPASSTTVEERGRLQLMSEVFNVFTDREDALRWLLHQGTESPENLRTTPRDYVTVTDAKAGASAAPETLKLKETSAKSSKPSKPMVGVVDVGGTAGRKLLARIHREAYLASINGKSDSGDGVITLRRSRLLSRLRAGTSVKSLSFGLTQELRDGHLSPGTEVPTWTGERMRWWWLGAEPFTLALNEKLAVKKFDSLILGVGDSRFFGERELAALLERLWEGSCRPSAIVRADHVNPDLLRWVRNEFPRTPEFSDSWEGGMQALDVALRVAQKRSSA